MTRRINSYDTRVWVLPRPVGVRCRQGACGKLRAKHRLLFYHQSKRHKDYLALLQ